MSLVLGYPRIRSDQIGRYHELVMKSAVRNIERAIEVADR